MLTVDRITVGFSVLAILFGAAAICATLSIQDYSRISLTSIQDKEVSK